MAISQGRCSIIVRVERFPTSRPGVWERKERPQVLEDDTVVDDDDVCMDHDYASATYPAAVNLALDNMSLREEIHRLREQVEKLTMNQRFGIHRFFTR